MTRFWKNIQEARLNIIIIIVFINKTLVGKAIQYNTIQYNTIQHYKTYIHEQHKEMYIHVFIVKVIH